MIKQKIILNLVILLIISYLLFAVTVSAAGLVPCGTRDNPTMCTVCDFYRLLQNIINFFLFVLAPLATLVAIYIAFIFLFSGGSPQRITDAKSKLRLLIWGIIVVLGSWLLLNTILNLVVDPKVFRMPWNQISCGVAQSSRTGPAVVTENPSKPASLKPNTREQLIAWTSFLLRNDPVFANEVTRLLNSAESSPAPHKFFLEINKKQSMQTSNYRLSYDLWLNVTIKDINNRLAALFPLFRTEELHIISVSPQQATPGSTVTITGAGFAPTDNTFNLTFPDGVVATYNNIPSQENGTAIQGTIPQVIMSGQYSFFISNENGVSNTATLDIIANNAVMSSTENEDGSIILFFSLGKESLSADISPSGVVTSITVTESNGLTTSINGVTVSSDGTVTGTLSGTVPNGQVDLTDISVAPDGTVTGTDPNTGQTVTIQGPNEDTTPATIDPDPDVTPDDEPSEGNPNLTAPENEPAPETEPEGLTPTGIGGHQGLGNPEGGPGGTPGGNTPDGNASGSNVGGGGLGGPGDPGDVSGGDVGGANGDDE